MRARTGMISINELFKMAFTRVRKIFYDPFRLVCNLELKEVVDQAISVTSVLWEESQICSEVHRGESLTSVLEKYCLTQERKWSVLDC